MTDRRTFLRSTTGALGALSLRPGALLGQPRHRSHVHAYGSVDERPPRALRILILGGTSFLGPHQVHLALERGHSVSVFNRGRTEPRLYQEDFDHVERLVGDREDDLSALEGRDWDVVIDNSTRRAAWADATVELLRESAEHYVFVSSTGVYYPYLTPNVDEDGPVPMEDSRDGEDGSMAYGVMKAQGGQAVRDGFGDRGIVLRPGHIAGPGDTQPNRFPYWTTRIERGGETLVPGMRSDPTQVIDVRDLTGFMFHLFEGGNGGTFNVVGSASPMSMEEFVHGLRACSGESVSWVWADDHAWLEENDVGGVIPWILPQGEELAHMRVDPTRALEAGLTIRPLANLVMDTMAWWHSDAVSEEVRTETRFPLTPERERELIEAWRARD